MYKLYELFSNNTTMETTEKNKEPGVALMYLIIIVTVYGLAMA
jgi:hypothetical protein